MFRRLAAVILSVVLLSPGWLGMTGLTLPFAMIPLLWISASYDQTRRSWWRMFWLGGADLRAVEHLDRLVDMERHPGGARGRDARLNDAQHDRLHVVPHRRKERAEGAGIHLAHCRVDRNGILGIRSANSRGRG
ncbi:MAG: hypothetical protein ACLUQ6_02565 [Alistipes onderdonkii]